MTDRERQDLINQALRQAARTALETARKSNTKLVLWLDGKPVEVAPEDIDNFVKANKDALLSR
jgi:hypothetical protein